MNSRKQNLKWYGGGLLGLLILVFLDQWTKHLAVIHLKNQPDIEIIPGVFQLHYLENRGAAFGILQNQQWIFILLCFFFLFLITWLYLRLPRQKYYLPLAVLSVGISAGAIGNLIDRIRLNYVVDFLYASFINFPVFNVADIYVTVSVILLVIFILFFYKDDEDFSFLKKDGKKDGNVSSSN
ncbi:MAG: signal peptidase II [Ruminococcus sp.]|jgi:signal peptidase II